MAIVCFPLLKEPRNRLSTRVEGCKQNAKSGAGRRGEEERGRRGEKEQSPHVPSRPAVPSPLLPLSSSPCPLGAKGTSGRTLRTASEAPILGLFPKAPEVRPFAPFSKEQAWQM